MTTNYKVLYSQQQRDPIQVKIDQLENELRKQQLLSIPIVSQLSPNEREEVIQVGTKLLSFMELGQIARIVENEILRRSYSK